MGFYMLGCPKPKKGITEKVLRLDLKMFVSNWAENLNFKNYKKLIFPMSVQKFSYSNEQAVEMPRGKAIKVNRNRKNKFIEWELTSLNNYLKWLAKIFRSYDIKTYDFSIFKREYQVSSTDNTNFLKEIKKSKLPTKKLNRLIQEKVDSLNEEDIIYFYIILFQDLLKIKDFLENQYDHTLSREKLSQEESEKQTRLRDTDNGKDHVITFKDLFQEEKLYHEIIDLLLENKLLETAKDGKWKLSAEVRMKVNHELKAMSALGYILYWKNYFKQGVNKTNIARGLSEFFSLKIEYRTYLKNHKSFKATIHDMDKGKIIPSSDLEYLNLYPDIKPKQAEYFSD